MVLRMSVACTTERRSSAAVSASRSKPSSRDHRPTYIDGAYCAWIPPIRSSARGSGVRARSSSSWRASSARLSSELGQRPHCAAAAIMSTQQSRSISVVSIARW